jgi:hypothetical protein
VTWRTRLGGPAAFFLPAVQVIRYTGEHGCSDNHEGLPVVLTVVGVAPLYDDIKSLTVFLMNQSPANVAIVTDQGIRFYVAGIQLEFFGEKSPVNDMFTASWSSTVAEQFTSSVSVVQLYGGLCGMLWSARTGAVSSTRTQSIPNGRIPVSVFSLIISFDNAS